MRISALMTEDLRFFYRVVKELKSRGIPFVSLSKDEIIPANVGVVLTTRSEGGDINFRNKIEVEEDGDVVKAVEQVQQILTGREKTEYLIIGIDPGLAPGLAVVCDGELINQYKCFSPKEVKAVVEKIFSTYRSKRKKVKIGHQAITPRNRMVNDLLELKREVDFDLEIVDESNTTTSKHDADINAAVEIAFQRGALVEDPLSVEPTEGEIREIQRISRITSNNRITISKELAEKVAKGELELRKAIECQGTKD